MRKIIAAVALLLHILEMNICLGAVQEGRVGYYSNYNSKACSNTGIPDDGWFMEASRLGDLDTYANGENCGRYFSIKCVSTGGVCKTEKPVNVTVVDACGCPDLAFQLSKEAFASLADINKTDRISIEFSGPFEFNFAPEPAGSSTDLPNPTCYEKTSTRKPPLGIILGSVLGALAVVGAVLWLLFLQPQRYVDLTQYKTRVPHKKVNDHLYELFPFAEREERTEENPEVDIVLFHGPARDEESSDEAYWQNWMANDGQFFPEFLVKDFPNCRIYAVTYDARVIQSERMGQLDHYLLAENLQHDLLSANEAALGQTCPVVLIGHSTGGNVIKSFIHKLVQNDCRKENERFLQSLRGIYYFSTPHEGMDLEALLVSMGFHNRTTDSPIYACMDQLNRQLARVTEEINNWLRESGSHVMIGSVWEGRLQEFRSRHKACACTNLCCSSCNQSMSFQIVSEASARGIHGANSYFFTAERVNHFTVCKIKEPTDSTYSHLHNFIVTSVPEGQLTQPSRSLCNVDRVGLSSSKKVTVRALSRPLSVGTGEAAYAGGSFPRILAICLFFISTIGNLILQISHWCKIQRM